jgi:sec-independent protein translocase protein TatC
LILFVVVYGLYEISIHLVAMVERQKDRQALADGVIEEGESLFDDVDEEAFDEAHIEEDDLK